MIVCLIILAVVVIILLIPIKLELIYSKDEIGNKASVTVKYSFVKFRVYPKKQSLITTSPINRLKNPKIQKKKNRFPLKKRSRK